jgi:hypothetical protein
MLDPPTDLTFGRAALVIESGIILSFVPTRLFISRLSAGIIRKAQRLFCVDAYAKYSRIEGQ